MKWVWLMLVVSCCARPTPTPPNARAFYFWRSTFRLSATERAALERTQVTRLFVRFFDVALLSEGDAQPVGPLVIEEPALPPGLEVIPTVFLREQVFRPASGVDPSLLASRVWTRVTATARELGQPVHELELDCDWAEGSRANYFAFLTALARVAGPGVRLGATIRLHQVKYRERTGVPPVERGMLMAYNMGQLDGDPTHQSIFDAERAKAYLGRLAEYPLPLDVGLPVWSWVVQVRDGAVVGLLQHADPTELGHQAFLRRDADGRFTATTSAFLQGTMVREGDQLKPEGLDAAATEHAAELIAAKLRPEPRTVALFDLSDRNLDRLGVTTLEHLFATKAGTP